MGEPFLGCLNHWTLRNTCGRRDMEKHTIMLCFDMLTKSSGIFFPPPTTTPTAMTAANDVVQRIFVSVF